MAARRAAEEQDQEVNASIDELFGLNNDDNEQETSQDDGISDNVAAFLNKFKVGGGAGGAGHEHGVANVATREDFARSINDFTQKFFSHVSSYFFS